MHTSKYIPIQSCLLYHKYFFYLSEISLCTFFLQDGCVGECIQVSGSVHVRDEALEGAQLCAGHHRSRGRGHPPAPRRAARHGGQELQAPLLHTAGVHQAATQSQVREERVQFADMLRNK